MTTPVTAVGRATSGRRLVPVQGPVMPDHLYRQIDQGDRGIPANWLHCGYHYCPDWDGMLIGPSMSAYDACTCPGFKMFRPAFTEVTEVTAVGRLLQPRHGEPRILHRIRRDPITGKLSTIAKIIFLKEKP